MRLSLDEIRIDCGTQSRKKIYQETIDNYAEKLRDGESFPPVEVYFDGLQYYMADGFHRYFAHKLAGSPGIECNVVNGTLRECQLRSKGVNDDHGIPRTIEDKWDIVDSMFDDIEYSEWSDREIAKACKVSHPFVAKVRKARGQAKEKTKFVRDGKDLVMSAPIKKAEAKEEQADELVFAMKPDEEMADAIALLKAENEALSDKLAIASMDADEVEKQMAESTIKDLRAQIRLFEIELSAVKQSRDTFQAENAQLMKQVASLQKKLKKYEAQ